MYCVNMYVYICLDSLNIVVHGQRLNPQDALWGLLHAIWTLCVSLWSRECPQCFLSFREQTFGAVSDPSQLFAHHFDAGVLQIFAARRENCFHDLILSRSVRMCACGSVRYVRLTSCERGEGRETPPCRAVYSLSSMSLARPKSAILHSRLSPTRMLAERRSLWI